jgi:uncharacterized protein
MKSVFFLLLSVTIGHLAISQSVDELNKQWTQLIGNKQYKEALPILRKAAELNDAESQYNLGYLLNSGLLGERNATEAVHWFRKASANNYNDGHYAMMMAYGNGQGVGFNVDSAFQYAMKCAVNNDGTCMWNVVNCYLTGNGVIASIPKFKEWIIRLAKLPNPENLTQSGYITSARLQLAQFYRTGKYVDKDLYQSYLWYLIYNESKVDFSILEQNSNIEQIKALEKLLSPDRKKSAAKDAEALLGRKLLRISELHKNTL